MEYDNGVFTVAVSEGPAKGQWHGHCHQSLGRLETMKTNGIKKIGGAILGLLLFAGIMAVSSTTAQAQYPWNQDQYRRQERQRQERERELQRQRQRQTQQGGYYDQYGN